METTVFDDEKMIHALCSANSCKGTNQEITDLDRVNRSLFTKTVMALMSKQEISHQQLMSYLIDGGDYYCSHTFKTLKWGDIDRMLAKQEHELFKSSDTNIQESSVIPMDVDEPNVPVEDKSDDEESGDEEDLLPAQEEVT